MPVKNPAEAPPTSAECMRLRSMLSRALPEIPPIYFYDDRGSELFEEITNLSVYYQTRTEIGILEREASAIMAGAKPRRLVELGSGAGRKIRLLLDAWHAPRGAVCTMLDVNETFLEQSIARLSNAYPDLAFRGLVGDFTTDLGKLGPGGGRMTVLFAGTIGNLYPDERRAFFTEVARGMEPSDTLLVGADLIKDRARIEAAYDDPEGVTAAFNRNALHVVNRRFKADFEPESFAHRAFYDAENAWIEMRLVATKSMRVHLAAIDMHLDLPRGAEIRTEVSCKFSRASLDASARQAGLSISDWYTDPEGLFALASMRKA